MALSADNAVASASQKPTVPVASPCVSICALNDEGFCIGCYRTGDEIRLWQQYTEQEKHRVLHQCEQRAAPSMMGCS